MILCENCSPRKGCTADKNRTECRFYQPMTEQEYLQTCNTEQLAEFLADEINDVIERVLESVWLNDGDTDRDEYYQRKSDVVEWLKQPHNSPK